MEKLVLTPEEKEQLEGAMEPVNFLFRIDVTPNVHPDKVVYVYGVSAMISAAGDLAIQNASSQRVFGAASGQWDGWFLVDPETLLPIPEVFPKE